MKHPVWFIGNAHIDPVWLWNWQEGFSEIKATFRSALDRMNECEDFVFTAAGASYYQWIEENEPEMLEEIRRRVKEGRWVIAGGMWVQPDCNMPCGESFARHALYSQALFRRLFGVQARFGYNVELPYWMQALYIATGETIGCYIFGELLITALIPLRNILFKDDSM